MAIVSKVDTDEECNHNLQRGEKNYVEEISKHTSTIQKGKKRKIPNTEENITKIKKDLEKTKESDILQYKSMITTINRNSTAEQNKKHKKEKEMDYQNQRNGIKLSNRYKALSSSDDSENESENETINNDEIEKENTTKIKRNEKPPPLVIHGQINENKRFINTIKEKLEGQFYIKHYHDKTEVFTTNTPDDEKLKTHWKESEVKFHTYTEKKNKKKILVVKGLHKQTNIEEMKKELIENGLEVSKINKMRGTSRPMYMVTVPINTKLGEVQKTLKDIQHTKVEWDKYITKKKITQCHRCQAWGHATSNCFAEPSCLKCAEQHITTECKKTNDTPVKCVNCSRDHPANAIICPVYIKRTQKIQTQSKNKNIRQAYGNKKPVQIGSIQEFPLLNKTKHMSPITNPWKNNEDARNKQQSNHVTPTTTINDKENENKMEPGINELLTITETIREINKMCDIQKMLNLVVQLKYKLSTCNTNTQKFQVMLEFTNKLDQNE